MASNLMANLTKSKKSQRIVIANFKTGMKKGEFIKSRTMFLQYFSLKTLHTLKNN